MAEEINEVNQFVALIVDADYEILTDEPHTIRRIDNQFIPKITNCKTLGYLAITLNKTIYLYHRVIATQFIPNPDNLPEIDHKDRNRLNNNLDNLRWVSSSDNNKNKNSHQGIQYNYIDELTDDAIVVTDYGKHKFLFLYFDNNRFYYYNGLQYRELHINEMKQTCSLYVQALDTDNIKRKISLNKFKKLYDIEF